MFDRVFVRGYQVVALPRRGTKTVGAVAFELSSGREIDSSTVPAERASGDGTGLRVDYLSSPVGRGPSLLRVFAGSSTEPVRTLELPDAISGVVEAPFGWYVGCRDGFLYGLGRSGDLIWRWQTPGAGALPLAGPGEVYFRPSPYRLTSNGRSALVSWLDSLWSVSPSGVTEWGLRLQDLSERQVTEIRLRSRDHAAAVALGVNAHASRDAIKRAYREAVKHAHPDLHPDDATAAERFRSVQEAYESLSDHAALTGNGDGSVIRFHLPSLATVSSLDVVDTDWLVGSGAGLFRLTTEGRLVAHVRIAIGAVLAIHDASQAVVAFCAQPVAFRPQPNLWFVDASAPVRLPDQYPWPDHLLGSYGNYLLAHRPRGRDLGLIDETGRIAVQLRCPRPITSICVTEGALLFTAGALICLEIDGLSPLTRVRIWRPPFTRGGFHQPTASATPKAG
jgi:DnaJ domain